MFLFNFIPWYLWNKYKLLEIIKKEIWTVSQKWDTICDLFAWSWVVWDFLKEDYTIIANDIEYYSYLINELNLNFNKKELLEIDLNNIINEIVFEINASWLKTNKKKENEKYYFYNNYSWSYFSINQTLEIDFFRLKINNFNWFQKKYLLWLWIFWLYSIVNSVWNHFAQPRLNKEKNINIINKKFSKSLFDFILKKHNEILKNIDDINIKSENKVFNLDYKKLLTKKEKINTFYIDTPYTIDHYSRFYHILNTFAKYDYPEIEWMWLYRKDRFQSPFCIKTKVENEFDNMIKLIKKNYWANIILSYSDSYRSLLHKDKIIEILNRYYSNVKLKEISYNYSWLWQKNWLNKSNELLFIVKI